MDDSRGNLAFLAWVDVVERIDTLLLEIRHIQANIIYVLKWPSLYDELQGEENKLWPPQPPDSGGSSSLGGDNEDGDNNRWPDVLSLPIDSALKESCHWVKGYPTLEKQLVKNGNIIWNEDQKRHYHKLRSLQLLKSNLLHDKVHLCWRAVRLFDIEGLNKVIPSGGSQNKEAYKYAHFMLFRSAVLAKIRENVRWVGDLQDQFENDQDLGRQDHPRPSFARRREQGIYTTFLAERARDIASDLHSLMGRFLDGSYKKESLTMHRWMHNYSSEGSVCQNDFRVAMGKEKSDSTEAEDYLDRINFINTSYWMPERPDLQSVIAHESAHQVIHERLFQFRDVWNEGNDAFSRLARELVYAMELFTGDDGKGESYQRHRPNITVIEMSSDLLATAVKGHAYVYALFLEIFGYGMEVMFDAPVDRYELAMADHLNCYSGILATDREWYYRLRIVCAWIRAIHHLDEPSRIDKMLVDGIEALLEDSLEYVSDLDVTHPESKAYWKTLTDRLCDIVSKSEAAALAKKWRRDRSEDCSNGGRHSVYYKKHSRRLPSELRSYIFRYVKEKKEKLLEKQNKYFDAVYLGRNFITQEDNNGIGGRPLFQHLYDVPWQSSMLKSIDFTELLSKEDLNEWLQKIHYDLALGREAYQIAIEFELWTTKTASIRARKVSKLMEDVGLAKYLIFSGLLSGRKNTGLTGKDLIDYYVRRFQWFSDNISWLWERIDSLIVGANGKVVVENDEYQLSLKELASLHYGYDVNGEKLEPSLGAVHLNVLDALTINLLRKLKGLVDEYIQMLPSVYAVLAPISGYLNSINNPSGMLSTLLSAEDRSIQPYMISRIRISGQTISADLSDKNIGNIQPLLGRYDYLHIYATKPMCRCKLPDLGGGDKINCPPFFSRRELGVRYVRNNNQECNSNKNNVAVLAVTLNLRQERLDFLYRLLTTKNRRSSVVCVDGIGGLLGSNVQIYLTEGWCDILILFSQEGQVLSDRLSDIFRCQNIIFQDFMVDNTELMLSPDMLEAVNNSPEYKITIHVRIQEDRSLKGGNEKFIKTIKENAVREKIGVCVTRTPGVTDYAIDVVSGKLTLLKIQGLFENVQIDVVQTTLGKVVIPQGEA